MIAELDKAESSKSGALRRTHKSEVPCRNAELEATGNKAAAVIAEWRRGCNVKLGGKADY